MAWIVRSDFTGFWNFSVLRDRDFLTQGLMEKNAKSNFFNAVRLILPKLHTYQICIETRLHAWQKVPHIFKMAAIRLWDFPMLTDRGFLTCGLMGKIVLSVFFTAIWWIFLKLFGNQIWNEVTLCTRQEVNQYFNMAVMRLWNLTSVKRYVSWTVFVG